MFSRQCVSCGQRATAALQLRTYSKPFGPVKEINIPTAQVAQEVVPNKSFLSLLRNSKLMQLGDPGGKLVEGKVVQVVGDDVYLDWGGKFLAVCSKPRSNPEKYVRGARVRLRLFDVELSSRFLGSTVDLTLLESDAKIVNIISSPYKSPKQ